MKLRIVSSRNEIKNLNSNEKMIHLAFRPNNVDLLNLTKKCPIMRAIQIPPSHYKTLSNSNRVFMNMEGIELLSGDVWGHRKDLDEYLTIDNTTLKEILALAKNGMPVEEIANEIKEKT